MEKDSGGYIEYLSKDTIMKNSDRKKDFVITSLQHWDTPIGTTMKNTALEISKKNRVLYLSTPLDYISWCRYRNSEENRYRIQVLKGKAPEVRQINDNMWVVDCPFLLHSVSKLPFKWLFDSFNKKNNRKIADQIARYARELDFKDYILFMDNDIFRSFYLKDFLTPQLSIYYRRDYLLTNPYWKRYGVGCEAELIRKSDIALANSLYFADEIRIHNSNTFDIETGVNLEIYDSSKNYEEPEDMKDIPHPIVGYTGALVKIRIDEEFLLHAAVSRPQYSFVLVGPEDGFYKTSKLHNLPNVYFLGKKQVEELPAYITAFDVCINPQIVNRITIGNYPLKIDEYLAMGKPVVATRTETMLHIFKNYTYLAECAEKFVSLLDQAMNDVCDSEKRDEAIRFGRSHSWENSVNKIYNIIDNYFESKGR